MAITNVSNGTSVEVVAGGSVELEKGTYSVTSKGTSNISSLTFDVSSVTTETTTETTTQTTTTTTTETTTETTTAFPIVTVDLTQEAGVNPVGTTPNGKAEVIYQEASILFILLLFHLCQYCGIRIFCFQKQFITRRLFCLVGVKVDFSQEIPFIQ